MKSEVGKRSEKTAQGLGWTRRPGCDFPLQICGFDPLKVNGYYRKEPVAFGHPLEWDLISWIGREGKIVEQAKKSSLYILALRTISFFLFWYTVQN